MRYFNVKVAENAKRVVRMTFSPMARDGGDSVTLDMDREDCAALQLEMLKLFKPHAGKSIFERLWERLDETVDSIMSGEVEDAMEQAELRGQARGLAMALSFGWRPGEPDWTEVRDNAMRRYYERENGQHHAAPRAVKTSGAAKSRTARKGRKS